MKIKKTTVIFFKKLKFLKLLRIIESFFFFHRFFVDIVFPPYVHTCILINLKL